MSYKMLIRRFDRRILVEIECKSGRGLMFEALHGKTFS